VRVKLLGFSIKSRLILKSVRRYEAAIQIHYDRSNENGAYSKILRRVSELLLPSIHYDVRGSEGNGSRPGSLAATCEQE